MSKSGLPLTELEHKGMMVVHTECLTSLVHKKPMLALTQLADTLMGRSPACHLTHRTSVIAASEFISRLLVCKCVSEYLSLHMPVTRFHPRLARGIVPPGKRRCASAHLMLSRKQQLEGHGEQNLFWLTLSRLSGSVPAERSKVVYSLSRKQERHSSSVVTPL